MYPCTIETRLQMNTKIYPPVMGIQINYSVFVRIYFVYYSRAQAKYLLTNTVVGHGGDNRRICIQPQSRRSSHYCMTMIKRPLSRFFQFQGSQHSFQDCMDYILPGLHRKHSTTPSPRQRHCSLHRCGFSLLIGKSSSSLSFFIFLGK